MSKKKRRDRSEVVVLGLNGPRQSTESVGISTIKNVRNSKITRIKCYLVAHRIAVTEIVLVLLLGLGGMAMNDWLPHTDKLTGRKTGWFGQEVSKNASTAWNPFALPPPSPIPQLSKEYIYAGSKLLAVADANADAAPPADLAIWRPSNGGAWCIYNGGNECELTTDPPNGWGMNGDIPVQGDYDGDGKTDFSVFRPSPSPATDPHWYIKRSSDSAIIYDHFGYSDDIPVVADYDGDGKTDIAVWRPSNRHWYIRPSGDPGNPNPIDISFGTNGDKPIAADFDGDGKADIGVWRGSPLIERKFYYRRSTDGQYSSPISMNSPGTPVCADYDGDGKADFALLSGNIWTIKSSITGLISNTTWYYAGDIPVPNDYDGDGKADIAVWHLGNGNLNESASGYWCILQSHDLSTRTNQFGQAGDIPVPANYRR